MTLIKRGKIWHMHFQVGLTRVRESTNTRNREVAERIERDRRTKVELGLHGLRPLRAAGNVSKAVEAFFAENEAHWGARTFEIHQNSWKHLKPFFGAMLLQDIQAKHIGLYQRDRLKQNVSGRTINIEMETLRAVLIKHRLWPNIAGDVHQLRQREDVGRALTPDEQKRILAAAETSVSRSLYPAVLLSLHTGMRNEELRMLRWQQVDFLRREVRVGKSKTKGGEGRVIPLTNKATACLQEWKSKFPDAKSTDFVFCSEKYKLAKSTGPGASVKVYACDPTKPIGSFKTAWRTARKAAGVSCRWHDIRHSAASLAQSSGATDTTMEELFGWERNSKMAKRYSHVTAEAKRNAMRAFDVDNDSQEENESKPEATDTKMTQSLPGGKEVIQ